MKYTKQSILNISEETHFISNNVEKVIRLLDVLEFIFTNSSFKDDVILKGGTAINLVHTNLTRLSVDIDLDYQGSLSKEAAFIARNKIEQELNSYMVLNRYSLSNKSRGSVALLSRLYQYTNAFGNIDYIKIEINFMDRVSIYPTNNVLVAHFNKDVQIKAPSIEELYGMKLCALIDRSKPRDLFDAKYLFENIINLDIAKLKKALIFYLSLDGIFLIDENIFKGIESINQNDIKRELQPVLQKGSWFNLKESTTFVIRKLKELLRLNDNEKLYLSEFSKGDFDASLLFDSPYKENAASHPMIKWRLHCIKNN